MKKVFKYFSVYLIVLAVLACTAFSFPVGASAATSYWSDDIVEYPSPYYPSFDGDGQFTESYDGIIYAGAATGPSAFLMGDSAETTLPSGNYIFHGTPIPDNLTGNGPSVIRAISVLYADGSQEDFPYGSVTITDDVVVVYCASFNSVPTIEPDRPEPLYYSAFDMFANFIYGEGAELTAEQNMVLTILATACALFVIVVPFLIVLWIIRLCTGG